MDDEDPFVVFLVNISFNFVLVQGLIFLMKKKNYCERIGSFPRNRSHCKMSLLRIALLEYRASLFVFGPEKTSQNRGAIVVDANNWRRELLGARI